MLLAQNKGHHRHFLKKLSVKHVLNVAELKKLNITILGQRFDWIGSSAGGGGGGDGRSKKEKMCFSQFLSKIRGLNMDS